MRPKCSKYSKSGQYWSISTDRRHCTSANGHMNKAWWLKFGSWCSAWPPQLYIKPCAEKQETLGEGIRNIPWAWPRFQSQGEILSSSDKQSHSILSLEQGNKAISKFSRVQNTDQGTNQQPLRLLKLYKKACAVYEVLLILQHTT